VSAGSFLSSREDPGLKCAARNIVLRSMRLTDDGKWHIYRLGRKTFVLPNRCGVLSFSVDCGAAFRSWDKLSDAKVAITLLGLIYSAEPARRTLTMGQVPEERTMGVSGPRQWTIQTARFECAIGALVLSGHIGSVGLYQRSHEQIHDWQVVVITLPVDGFVEIHPGQTTVAKPDKR
jgi:hypothetical protein